MEDLWNRAKSLAEEAAKKTQSVTRSTNFTDIVAETAKKSKELAAEASKRADLIKIAAIKQADQLNLKSLSDFIPPQLAYLSVSDPSPPSDAELEKFGITDDLRSSIRGLTATTFQSFEVQDKPEVSDVVTISNVRQDLTEWQARHATLVLSTVKEISKLRYELCPRVMKERKFWRIYFTLVNSHVAPYEKQYMEELKLEADQARQDDKAKQSSIHGEETDKSDGKDKNVKSRTSTSSSAEQDLDSFLLGDLEDSDDGGGAEDGDDGEVSFDDDFDKIENSEIEEENQLKVKAPSPTS